MTPTPPVRPDDGDQPPGYIRGGAAGIDGHKVLRATVVLCLVGLAVTVVLLCIAAGHSNDRANRLTRNGQAVDATVTSCLGIASGTGDTEYYFECQASFTVEGHRYVEGLRDSRLYYPPGTVLRAEADLAHPDDLTLGASGSGNSASWRAFIPAIVVGAVLVLAVVAVLWWIRRGRRPRRTRPAVPTA
jgi:Protein of unknown function (DUF3592)